MSALYVGKSFPKKPKSSRTIFRTFVFTEGRPSRPCTDPGRLLPGLNHAQYIHSEIFINLLEYKIISKKGEGTFSEVVKAQMITTNKMVAIKRMKNRFDNIEQVNNLREIQALKRLSPHPHTIKLIEVIL